MLNSFNCWDTKDNASLMELEGLSNLSTLEVQIVNLELIPRGFRFFDDLQLDSFKISIGVKRSWDVKYEKSKDLIIKLESSFQLEHRIERLLRRAEDLSLDEVWEINFDGKEFPLLRSLYIRNDSSNIQFLIKSKVRPSSWEFAILESLYLSNMKSLEKFCDGHLAVGSFGKLQKLKVTHCHKLKCLFSISSAKCMSRLQKLEIEFCDSVKAVVNDGAEDGQNNNEVIEFTQLKSSKLNYLPNLKWFRRTEAGTAQLLNDTVSFPNLTSLVVHKCKNLNYIFTTSMVKCLGQLKVLEIQSCESVEDIMLMRKSEEIEEESIDKILFPKLDSLELSDLPNLRRFCCGHLIEFPSLKTLTIYDCRAMENFVSKFSSISDNNGSDGYFFNEMVTLSNLETLKAHDMDSFRYLWDEKLIAGDSFCKLLSLNIDGCSKLQVIFSSNVYRRFQSLETLVVHDCGDVQEIYQYEGVDLEEDNNVPKFALQKLDLSSLRSLKHIWSKDSDGDSEFRSLQSVSISRCEDLKYVFTKSVASDMVHLQHLKISQCGAEMMIISKNSEDCLAYFEVKS